MQYNLQVFYEDTDAGGIVYHANYFKFIERARSLVLSNNGIDQLELLEKDKLAFVVVNISGNYYKPAKLGDSLIVQTRLQKLGKFSINLEQEIFNGSASVFLGKVRLACVNIDSKKPVEIPEKIKQVFKKY